MDPSRNVKERTSKIEEALKHHNYEILETLLNLDSLDSIIEIRIILDDNPNLFSFLCQNGLFSILSHLLDHLPLDVNSKYNGFSGLQYACKKGHAKVVDLLLKSGAEVNENIWEGDSEFYLSSLHGHIDVVETLLGQNVELLQDASKCYCLFHAACKGGHIHMMKKWLQPNMDINSEIAFVPCLNECENQFPLYATCEGNHLDATVFLIGDLRASISKKICNAFPHFITKAVQKLFKIFCQGKIMFLMGDLDLECVLPIWFGTDHEPDNKRMSSDLTDEIEINLSKNKICDLPPELLWDLPCLVDLQMSYNLVKQIPEPLSNTFLQKNCLTSLDLSHCHMTKLTHAIFCLPSLKKLNASHNFLEELYENDDNPTKWGCRYLTDLDLSHNCLRHLPKGIKECLDLESITLCHNQLTEMGSPWQCPLKFLDLSDNKIISFPASADKFWDTTLKRLNACNNVLDEISESIIKMKYLSHLNLSMNKINILPDSSLWLCPLVSLNLSHNELGSTMGQNTTWSRFSRKGTRKVNLTFPGSTLKNSLTELDLSYNDLVILPPGLCDAESLSVLDLSL